MDAGIDRIGRNYQFMGLTETPEMENYRVPVWLVNFNHSGVNQFLVQFSDNSYCSDAIKGHFNHTPSQSISEEKSRDKHSQCLI
jgi:hypothetical protein